MPQPSRPTRATQTAVPADAAGGEGGLLAVNGRSEVENQAPQPGFGREGLAPGHCPGGRGCPHEVPFFLEYDRGTEPLDRLAAKLVAYHELAVATKILTPVLFWLPSTGREVSVREALANSHRWARVRFVVATASPTLALGPAEAAWPPLRVTWPRRLVELADEGD